MDVSEYIVNNKIKIIVKTNSPKTMPEKIREPHLCQLKLILFVLYIVICYAIKAVRFFISILIFVNHYV